ncbi:hypothetical protein [Ancylomarina sp. 16SWW S1-10-2]|uniref:hypothetical protein n=1 Tax=Ancylomarina sp. 16SWW S1-10-2 TaxID=2499681 RepID=UPI0012ADAF7B|nr:hypothetical protein [Ancylomarina sp. 16SWW S1-10-2]MRT94634.1 hypothetical protein [Ancylomarina sp. 16SWW S1-10-2]
MNILIIAFTLLCMHNEAADYELLGTRQYTYNEIGLKTEKISFDAEGKLERKVIYSYDEKGHKIKTEKYTAMDSLMAVYEYQFNEKDKKANSLKTDYIKGKKSNKIYAYNERGQMIRSEYYAHGSLLKSVNYTYDEFGNQNKYEVKNAKGKQITLWITENKYNKKGLLSDKFKRDEKGNLVTEYHYDYNEKAQISTSFANYYSGKRPNSKRVYTYNAKGQKIGFKKFALRSAQL